MSLLVDSNEDDFTYDDTTTFKKVFSTTDDSDDEKVRISAAICFVLLRNHAI